MITDRRTATFAVTRGHQLALDLPSGPASAPAEPLGLAALASRYLGDRRLPSLGGFAARAGWQGQHVAQPRRSCFSYWAPRITTGEIREAKRSMHRHPAPAELARLKQAQLAAAARLATDSIRVMLRAIHGAAWGETQCIDVQGSQEALEKIDDTVFTEYLDRCAASVQVLHVAGDRVLDRDGWGPTPSDEGADTPGWRGGVGLVPTASDQYKLAVQYRYPEAEIDEVSLAVIGELLGRTTPGRLMAELRDRLGLVYSAGAMVATEHGSPVVVAYATTSRAQVVECAGRLAALAGDLRDVPAAEWRSAGRRVARRAEMLMDGPFALIEDHRRDVEGLGRLADRARTAAERAEMLAVNGVQATDRQARAVVGALDDELSRRLERPW